MHDPVPCPVLADGLGTISGQIPVEASVQDGASLLAVAVPAVRPVLILGRIRHKKLVAINMNLG